jgi:hypothetical protein
MIQESRSHAQVTSTRIPIMDVMLEIYVDGPYGTSTREIFDTEHAVLIAAGIGVTPFASILQSVMFRYIQSKSECPNCGHTWHEDGAGTNTLKKVIGQFLLLLLMVAERSFVRFVLPSHFVLSDVPVTDGVKTKQLHTGNHALHPSCF